jgi:hypothetical protein
VELRARIVRGFMKAQELSAEILDQAESIGQRVRHEIESLDQRATDWEGVGL